MNIYLFIELNKRVPAFDMGETFLLKRVFD